MVNISLAGLGVIRLEKLPFMMLSMFACREAEIENLHFHDLRHTAASYMVMSGVDLPTVKEILGHIEINMTMRYSHLAPAHKAKAVKQLGDMLEQIAKGPSGQQAEAVAGIQTPPNLAHFPARFSG
jgi:hypothetical protein